MAGFDYVPLTALKPMLGIEATDTSQDARIALLADIAAGMIEGYCAREFPRGEYAEALVPTVPDLFLRNYPIHSVQTLQIDGTVVASDQIAIFGPAGRLRLRSGSWVGQTVEVSYTAGYTLVPAELRYVLIDIVGQLMARNVGAQQTVQGPLGGMVLGRGGVRTISIPDAISITYDTGEIAGSSAGSATFGTITHAYANVLLAPHVPVLDMYRSDRAAGVST